MAENTTYSLDSSKIELREGETVKINISPSPEEGKTVTWKSESEENVSIETTDNSSAFVLGLKAGKCSNITATIDGVETEKCQVQVYGLNKDHVTLKADETIPVNDSSQGLCFMINDECQKENVTWDSNNNDNIIKIEGNKLIPCNIGSTTVSATYDGKSATCSVKVLPPFTLNKYATTILLGGTDTLQAIKNLNNSNTSLAIKWDNSNTTSVTLLNSGNDSNTTSDTQPNSGGDSNTTSDTQPNSGNDSNTTSDTQPNSGNDSNTTSDTQPNSGNDSNTTSDTQPNSEGDSNTTSDTQPNSGGDSITIIGSAKGSAVITATCTIGTITYYESCNVTVASNQWDDIIELFDDVIPQADDTYKGYRLGITFKTSTDKSSNTDTSSNTDISSSTDTSSNTDTSSSTDTSSHKQLAQGKEEKFKIGDKTVSVLLTSIHLHKEMYKPGCLEVTMETNAELADFNGLVTLSYQSEGSSPLLYTVADTYYIFEKKKKGRYVTLRAYSVDKFLTIDKFCQAFTGKKLVENILNETLNNYSDASNFNKFCTNIKTQENKKEDTTNDVNPQENAKGDTTNDVNPQENEKEETTNDVNPQENAKEETTNDVKPQENEKKDTTNYVVKNLQHLQKKTDDTNETVEAQLPYCVQYNESFHDFLVRICNRNGEFLYVEDNNLHVGIPNGTDPTEISEAYGYEIEFNEDYCEIANTSDAVTPNSVKKGVWQKSRNDEGEYTDMPSLPSNERIYPEEYLTKTTQYDKYGGRYTSGDMAHKEYEGTLRTYAKYEEFMRPSDGVLSALRTIAEAKTFYEGITDVAVDVAMATLMADKAVKDANAAYGKEYGEGGQHEFSSEGFLLDSNFYKEIFQKEELAGNGKCIVTHSTYKNHKLGDIVEIEGKTYVVYQVKCGATILDGFIRSENIQRYKEIFELTLLPAIGNNASELYPLPLKELRIRRATAQRAKVTKTLDPERLGRVRVKYPWQGEEENHSPWIRISYPMASGDAGFMFCPAEGDEVVVDYEDGNIDLPYIVGAFYNADNKPSIHAKSYTNTSKTISSGNGHHISFDDSSLGENFFGNLAPISICSILGKFGVLDKGNDFFTSGNGKYLGGGFEIADHFGFYSIKGSTDERNITISSPMGDINLNAYTGITISAPNGDVNIEGKNINITARNNLTLESGVNIDYPRLIHKWGGGFDSDIAKKYGKYACSKIFNMFILDVSLLRILWETIFRPIGGTMLLKSHRFMRLEAGKGEAKIAKQSLKNNHGENALGMFFNTAGTSTKHLTANVANVARQKVHTYAKTINDAIGYINSITVNKTNLDNTITENNFNAYVKGPTKDTWTPKTNQSQQPPQSQSPAPITLAAEEMKSLYDKYKQIKALYDSITTTDVCAVAKDVFTEKFNYVGDFVNNPFTQIMTTDLDTATITNDMLRIAIFKEFKDKLKSYYEFTEGPTQLNSGTYTQIGQNYYTISPKTPGTATKILNGFATIKEYIMPELDNFVEDKVWAEVDTGNILLSNNEGVTYSLTEKGTFAGTILNDTQSLIDFIKNANL